MRCIARSFWLAVCLKRWCLAYQSVAEADAVGRQELVQQVDDLGDNGQLHQVDGPAQANGVKQQLECSCALDNLLS